MSPDAETLLVAHTLRGSGFDASEDGTGRGTPLVCVPMAVQENRRNGVTIRDIAGTLRSNAPGSQPCGSLVLLPFDTTQITHRENRSRPEAGDPSPSLAKGGHVPAIAFHMTQDPIHGAVSPALGGKGAAVGAVVRRLTPTECERLMGFPDGYTAIPGAKDGPRYAALGNSFAVPVVSWIGKRIAMVDAMAQSVTLDARAPAGA